MRKRNSCTAMMCLSELHIIAFHCTFASIIESGIFHKASSLDHRTTTQIVRRFLVLVWRNFIKKCLHQNFQYILSIWKYNLRLTRFFSFLTSGNFFIYSLQPGFSIFFIFLKKQKNKIALKQITCS